MDAIRWDKDQDGVVVLTIDDPEQSANTMNQRFVSSFEETLDRLESERDSITGVVVTSAKKTFFAGGDLHDLRRARKEDAEEIAADDARGQVAAASTRDARRTRSSRDQRRRPRRRARDLPRLPPPRDRR